MLYNIFMEKIHITVCNDNCPERYCSTEEQIGQIAITQNNINDDVVRTVDVSDKCQGVCKIIDNSNYELIVGAVANVRVDIDGQGYIPGVAVPTPDGKRVVPKRLTDLYGN
jgi:hypothetical protein